MGTWAVEKRYSDFRNLHSQVTRLTLSDSSIVIKVKKDTAQTAAKENQQNEGLSRRTEKTTSCQYDFFLLADIGYMNELCFHFNIFEDKDVIDFIQLKGTTCLINIR